MAWKGGVAHRPTHKSAKAGVGEHLPGDVWKEVHISRKGTAGPNHLCRRASAAHADVVWSDA